MSSEDDPGLVRQAYRTVTPGYKPRGEGSMNAIGWAIMLGILVLMLPLLPFAVVVWLVSRGIDALAGRGEVEETESAG